MNKMYIKVNDNNGFNSIIDFAEKNDIKYESSNEIMEFVAEELIEQQIDNNIYDNKELNFIDDYKPIVINETSNKLRNLFNPVSEENKNIIKSIMKDYDHLVK